MAKSKETASTETKTVDTPVPSENGTPQVSTNGLVGDIERLTSEANNHLQQAKSFEAMYLKTLGAIDVLRAIASNQPGKSGD